MFSALEESQVQERQVVEECVDFQIAFRALCLNAQGAAINEEYEGRKSCLC